jgi:hypothetical protein
VRVCVLRCLHQALADSTSSLNHAGAGSAPCLVVLNKSDTVSGVGDDERARAWAQRWLDGIGGPADATAPHERVFAVSCVSMRGMDSFLNALEGIVRTR